MLRHSLIALFFLPMLVAAVMITEVNYDPPGSDNNLEFIELLDAANLTDWTIGDLASNDTLELLQNASNNYSLIVEEGFDYGTLSCNVYSAGATIGNNLNNGGDTLFLYAPNGSLEIMFAYNDSLAKSNGYSLSFFNGSWREGVPSPCLPNTINTTAENDTCEIRYDLSITPLLAERIYLGVTYTTLFRIKNEAYETGISQYVNATIRYALSRNGTLLFNKSFIAILKASKSANTGELQLNETGNYTLCGEIVKMNVSDENQANDRTCLNLTVFDPYKEPCNISLSLEVKEPKLFYNDSERIAFWNRVERHDNGTELPPYVIRYEIEELSGKSVRSSTTENTNLKSWTPHPKNELGVFLLKNRFELLACNNSNTQLSDTKLLVVQGVSESLANESTLEITKITAPKECCEAGDQVKVEVALYKGETAKYSVKLWLEDATGKRLSTIATIHAKQKFATYNLLLPVTVTKNTGSGLHRVLLEGLGRSTSKQVWFQGRPTIATAENETALTTISPFTITSFYTRSRKANEMVNLYSTIKGEGEVTVQLVGLQDYHLEELALNDSHQLKEAVRMTPGANIFLLTLLDKDGAVLAEKHLLLEMGDRIEKVDYFSPQRSLPVEEPVVEQKAETEKNSLAAITGNVTFAQETGTNLLPILFGIVGLLLLGILLQRR